MLFFIYLFDINFPRSLSVHEKLTKVPARARFDLLHTYKYLSLE